MHGRLGNQMFQYAFAKKIQINRSDDISIYFGRVNQNNGDNGWKDDLQHFHVDEYKIENNKGFLLTQMSIKQKCLLFKYIIKCKTIKNIDDLIEYQVSMQPELNRNGLYWIRNGEFKPVFSDEKNVFVCGHFEHYSLYLGMEEILRKQFTPIPEPRPENRRLYDVINNKESVCVSIRRGDFLSAENKDAYYVCDKDYFDRAIKKIRILIPESTLIFFSDDIQWIRQNCKYDGEVYYETDGNDVWEKIRLMSSCKHFVISNSTFSWWVQYLSENTEKVVISPSKWKNNSSYSGLISPSFIQI